MDDDLTPSFFVKLAVTLFVVALAAALKAPTYDRPTLFLVATETALASFRQPIYLDEFLSRNASDPRVTRSELEISAKRRWALLTIVHNEPDMLPVWYRHYSRHFLDEDMFVLDNNGDDGSADALLARAPRLNLIRAPSRYLDRPFHLRAVQASIDALLSRGYEHVLFCEVDELVFADFAKYEHGLSDFRERERLLGQSVSVSARHIIHRPSIEPAPIDFSVPILLQRSWWFRGTQWDLYDKTLLLHSAPIFTPGFHYAFIPGLDGAPIGRPHPDLLMVHLKLVDRAWYVHKTLVINQTSGSNITNGMFTQAEADRRFDEVAVSAITEVPAYFAREDIC